MSDFWKGRNLMAAFFIQFYPGYWRRRDIQQMALNDN